MPDVAETHVDEREHDQQGQGVEPPTAPQQGEQARCQGQREHAVLGDVHRRPLPDGVQAAEAGELQREGQIVDPVGADHHGGQQQRAEDGPRPGGGDQVVALPDHVLQPEGGGQHEADDEGAVHVAPHPHHHGEQNGPWASAVPTCEDELGDK